MLDNDGTLGVLGCGTVGEAIVRGLLRSGSLAPARIAASTRRPEAAEALATRHGVRTGVDNVQVAREASAVLVALKPQQLATVLDTDEMRDRAPGEARGQRGCRRAPGAASAAGSRRARSSAQCPTPLPSSARA